jgi:hypothetical protein
MLLIDIATKASQLNARKNGRKYIGREDVDIAAMVFWQLLTKHYNFGGVSCRTSVKRR